tara:strand:- start:236 stop:511 length:276 start_codon:yes stop_codon:yes gene_type:complete
MAPIPTDETTLMAYLTETQIESMANAAVTSYEFSCDWNQALHAVVEYSVDEFGVRPRRSAALYALKLAKLKWHALSLDAARNAREWEEAYV